MKLNSAEQLKLLGAQAEAFEERAAASGFAGLKPAELTTFQINVGRWCNQACRHCHVDASPQRTEMMDRETLEKCLNIIDSVPSITTVDITGGAPEGHPLFRELVTRVRAAGKHVIDRCNLTILSEPGHEDLADFLAANEVEIVASLPHFAEQRTDSQRGAGVFQKSIAGLKKLNALGYGSTLGLNLVYNPSGVFLSSNQMQLEREFREKLMADFGIRFNNLYCINNMPINRFLFALERAGKTATYLTTLVNAFNPQTIPGLMCRTQISVGYDGQVYDCDFNQMLEMPAEAVAHIDDFSPERFASRSIRTANHCYGCTAGSGSSCGGAVVG
ncbi:MAG: arsenosugar biosynthesis radical SAM (seleno)protein ArsS [Spirochaetota bacterium]